ncbi:10920_t:CDS:2, partial [Cetraspora pellucida]
LEAHRAAVGGMFNTQCTKGCQLRTSFCKLYHFVEGVETQIETAEQSSSRQRIDQGIENKDNDQIQDNNFNKSESVVHTCKQKWKRPILECNIVVK